jgi:hypothetical protein
MRAIQMTEFMSEDQRKVLVSFRDRALAIPIYRSAKRRAYYSEDFLEHGSLAYIMGEVFVGESDITETGIQFLKEFFGHARLAQLLVGHKNFRYNLDQPQTVKRLGTLVPNEMADFLVEVGFWKKPTATRPVRPSRRSD